jgi:chromosomal replication initiator protein
MRSAKEIWEAALGELELQVNKPNFNTWLAKTTGISRRENRITIGTPNAFVAEYLDTNQRSLIEKTLMPFRLQSQVHLRFLHRRQL